MIITGDIIVETGLIGGEIMDELISVRVPTTKGVCVRNAVDGSGNVTSEQFTITLHGSFNVARFASRVRALRGDSAITCISVEHATQVFRVWISELEKIAQSND